MIRRHRFAAAASAVLVLAACSDSAPAARVGHASMEPAASSSRPAAMASLHAPPRTSASRRRLVPSGILDATGFEQPMVATTLFAPHGWLARGGVFWGREFLCTNGYAFDWSATSPDGSAMIGVLPQQRWEANTYGAAATTPGCSLAPYTSARDLLGATLRQRFPGARELDFRARPDIARSLAHHEQSQPTPMGGIRTRVDAGELLFAFDDRGRAMRGTLSVAVILSVMRTDTGMGATMEALSANALPTFAVVAPDGALDFAFFEAIRRSITPNPAWEQRIARHDRAIAKVALDESRRQSDALLAANDWTSRLLQDTWNAAGVSADRRARAFGEALRGVQGYADADAPGGRVDLSATYGHAWRLDDGSYVLTDDAGFDPWRDLQVAGRALQPLR